MQIPDESAKYVANGQRSYKCKSCRSEIPKGDPSYTISLFTPSYGFGTMIPVAKWREHVECHEGRIDAFTTAFRSSPTEALKMVRGGKL